MSTETITHRPWRMASRLRHMYSRLASLNSFTELGAIALSNPQTLRTVTAKSSAESTKSLAGHQHTVSSNDLLTYLRQTIKHQLVGHTHDLHDQV